MLKILLVFVLLFFCCMNLQAQSTSPLLVGRVAVNQTRIAFTYAGKIWLVDRTGGNARRLSDTPNEETNPVFSPDGKQLAFSRSSGNDWDVYLTSADGKSEARRLTFVAKDDLAAGWTPDGREVIFQTSRDEEAVHRLYKIAIENGGLETALPLPQAEQESVSPDGNKIAYNPRNFRFREWRYYRGGLTAPIWITDLKTGATEKIPNQNFNDKNPMWVGDKIYFTSDRTGIFNLFAADSKTKAVKQLTKFDRQGIRAAGAAGDAICFVQNGRLHLFDLATGGDKIIEVRLTPDTSELNPRIVPAVRSVDNANPSASGDKIIFGARGEVLLFDLSSGEAKNLTNTSGIGERFPNLSPDGKSAAYFSDESGEYALHIRSLENDAVKKISIEQKPSFYFEIVWSPDSKKLVFADRRLNFWLADMESGTPRKIDTSTYMGQESWQPSWSPDSRFVAYAKRLKNRVGTIFIHDPAQKKSVQITDGVTNTESPVFDKNGKYLYLLSSPNALTADFGSVLNSVISRPLIVRRVHALLLTKETASPVLPNGQPNPEAKMSEVVSDVKIDFENPAARLINLPLPQRDYAQIIAGRVGKLFLVINNWSETPGGDEGQSPDYSIYNYELAKLGEMQKIADKLQGISEISRDGSKLLYEKESNWFLVSAETAPKPDEGKLDLSKMTVRVELQAEWRQMFHESMRLMRDWFYDPNHHGQNLKELEQTYSAYLPTVTRRADLNQLMSQMLGHISVGHLTVRGGDVPPPVGGGNKTGLLGADYEISNGSYRFKKIYRSTPYSAANGSVNAPLDQPGLNIKEGDYLLEVGGRKLKTDKNLYSYFENTAGQAIQIVVGSDAGGAGKRTLTVYPVSSESSLRRTNWAENNRKLVKQMSGGRLGYIFIDGYQSEGVMNAIRGLTGFAGKQGVIIDQRYNPGGFAPDYLIGLMQQKPLYNYLFRGGDDIAAPVNIAPPIKVMLTNEFNGSAAETAALMFRLGKVGLLVGKRTAGAGVGPYFFTPRLIDGGRVQLPNRAAYIPDGSSWGIENFGVEPDYDVEITPRDFMMGRDSQLEKAIEVALSQTGKTKLQPPIHPAFPVHPIEKPTSGNDLSVLPLPGSAFVNTEPKPK
jgi:tricorn protease